MFALLLAASLFTSDPAPVDKRCEPLRAPIRIRLSVSAEQWRDAAPAIRKVIDDTWSPEGLSIEWVDGGRSWDGIDLWIAVVPELKVAGEPYPFGMINFEGDRPARLARVSIRAARDWSRIFRAQLLKAPVMTMGGVVVDRDLVHRVLGYAAAHEAGHFILETKSHADSGVMQATYSRPDTILDAEVWRLDRRNADVLKQRLSNCGAGYGSPR